jgi:two-component system phosphate regulon sensor histidine kinase PhoR
VLRSRFLWRLYAGYALLVLVTVVTVGLLVGRRITADTRAEVELSLLEQAHLLRDIAAPALANGNGQDLQARVRVLGDSIETRLTVIAEDGVVLADSDSDPTFMDDHGSRPEVLAARAEGWATSTRFSRTLGVNLMYVAVAVTENGELRGYARTALPLTIIQDKLVGLRFAVALAALIAAVVALAVGLLVAGRVIAPLSSITAAAESIAGGNYQRRVGSKSSDEIGQLANAFNKMAGELEYRLQTITEDRSRLFTILGGMVEGVVAVDSDRNVVHLNAAAGRIFDVSPADSIGKPIWEVTGVPKVREALDETLQDAKEATRELRLVSGIEDKIVQLHTAPLQNAQGDLVGAVLVLHEVTELRRLETVRQDFVANVSHELKTPITAIRGLIDTVIEDREMPNETRTRFLGKIQDQAMRLSLLVTDLLTLARLESADGLLAAEPLDMRESVSGSLAQFTASAEELGIELVRDLPATPVRLVGEHEALELVVNNLLDNALKYTPRGGRVCVRLSTDETSAILEVEDTGIGIAREHHARVFERFYRIDKARSRELGGTGLGLAIVKHVCRTLGGSISVESEEGRGSTFSVLLPLSAISQQRPDDSFAVTSQA